MKKFTHARSLAVVLLVVSVDTSVLAQSLEINPVVVSASRLEQPLSPSQTLVQGIQWLIDKSGVVKLVRLTVAGAAQVGPCRASDFNPPASR